MIRTTQHALDSRPHRCLALVTPLAASPFTTADDITTRHHPTILYKQVTMRFLLILLVLCVAVYAAPQSKLLFANSDNNGKQIIEEVVVESVLHVKSPSAARQARTNVRTNLQDGSSVAEAKN